MSNGKKFSECLDCKSYMNPEYAFPCSACKSTGYRPDDKPSFFAGISNVDERIRHTSGKEKE